MTTMLAGAGGIDTDKEYDKELGKKISLFCLPENVGAIQVIRVIVKFLDNHPEMLHQKSEILIPVALAIAFPCS